MSRPAQPRIEQYVSTTCDQCGKKHGATLGHYVMVLGGCGKIYWALQPKRHGPFVLYPWPGHPKPAVPPVQSSQLEVESSKFAPAPTEVSPFIQP